MRNVVAFVVSRFVRYFRDRGVSTEHLIVTVFLISNVLMLICTLTGAIRHFIVLERSLGLL